MVERSGWGSETILILSPFPCKYHNVPQIIWSTLIAVDLTRKLLLTSLSLGVHSLYLSITFSLSIYLVDTEFNPRAAAASPSKDSFKRESSNKSCFNPNRLKVASTLTATQETREFLIPLRYTAPPCLSVLAKWFIEIFAVVVRQCFCRPRTLT